MKLRFRSNLVAGVIALVMAIVLYLLIPGQVGVEKRATFGINSRTMPYAMAILLAGCGAGLIFQSLVLKKDEVKEVDLKQEAKGLIYMAAIVLYAFSFARDFVISTCLLGIVTLVMQKDKKPMHYVVVIITVVVIYFLFTRLLHVRLPFLLAGLLG